MLKKIITLMVIIFLSGCTNPNTIPLTTNIQSVYYLNPNRYNRPSPIIIVIYQLKNASSFKHTDFYSIYNHASKTLGDSLIDKEQIEIKPNQTKNLKLHLSTKANYVGIIAAYRNINRAQWRRIIEIPTNIKAIKFNLELQSQSLAITHIKHSKFCIGSQCIFF